MYCPECGASVGKPHRDICPYYGVSSNEHPLSDVEGPDHAVITPAPPPKKYTQVQPGIKNMYDERRCAFCGIGGGQHLHNCPTLEHNPTVLELIKEKRPHQTLMAWRVAALKRIEKACERIDALLGDVGIEPDENGDVIIPVALIDDTPIVMANELKEIRDILMGNNKGE